MRHNCKEFEEFIKKNNIPMNEGKNIDAFTIFAFPEKITIDGIERPVLGGGTERRAVIALRDDDTLADIYVFHITSTPTDEESKLKLYKLLNELNTVYKYICFYENNNVVSVKACIPFNDNFDPAIVFETLTIMFQAVEDEYDKIRESLNLISKPFNNVINFKSK